MSIPCGFSEGLPVGLQLIGRPFEEGTMLRAAHGYAALTDWHLHRPAAIGTQSAESEAAG
jgi:aspartyl-tRNA(Asn)/glutamyl-tRNA(Gln) amidotransferase subunit A